MGNPAKYPAGLAGFEVPNNSFERDVCYAAASHTSLKLGVRQKNESYHFNNNN